MASRIVVDPEVPGLSDASLIIGMLDRAGVPFHWLLPSEVEHLFEAATKPEYVICVYSGGDEQRRGYSGCATIFAFGHAGELLDTWAWDDCYPPDEE